MTLTGRTLPVSRTVYAPASSLNAPGVSSSWIVSVAVACAPRRAPLVGAPRLSSTVRAPSITLLLRIGTVN